MNDLAILVPVLHRAHRAAPLVDNIRATTPHARVVFICTEDDITEQEACHATGATVLVLPGPRRPGDYARKINYAYQHTTEPNLFLAADDLVFRAGWYDTARAFLTDRIQVVGTNDLGNGRVTAGHHSTHTLVTRKYADEWGTIDGPGTILCELYNHWYVDDEFVQTAQTRRAFKAASHSIVEHLHPAWKKAANDDVYRLGQSRSASDRRIYERRKPRIGTPTVNTIAVGVISDGRLEYLAETIKSAGEHLAYPFVTGVLVDDSGNAAVAAEIRREYRQFHRVTHARRLGIAAAVNSAWSTILKTNARYVFHLEGDFTFNADVPLDDMCALLDEQKHLAQLVLKRQPVSPEEIKAGGYVEVQPDVYTDRESKTGRWAEHNLLFSLNPTVIRREVLELGPFTTEADFGRRVKEAGYMSAIWGRKFDPPAVTHIGEFRAKGWKT